MPTGLWLYSYILLWTLALFEMAVCTLLVRQVTAQANHWIQNDPEWGLPLGSLAPELPSSDVYGRIIPKSIESGSVRVLFFLSTTCHTCDQMMMRVHPTTEIPGVSVMLIVSASEEKTHLFLAKHRMEENQTIRVISDPENAIASAYHSRITPFLVVVDSDSRIGAKRAAFSLTEIGMMIERARRGTANRHIVAIPLKSE